MIPLFVPDRRRSPAQAAEFGRAVMAALPNRRTAAHMYDITACSRRAVSYQSKIRRSVMWRREPTLLIAVAASLLGLLVTIGFSWLTAEQAAVIVALLNAGLGVYNAVKVRPIAPPAFTYFVAAVAALAAAYGFEVGQETVGAVNGVVLTVLALLTRVQVTPKDDPAASLDPVRPVTLVDPPLR